MFTVVNNSPMMNALEKFRVEKGLTYEQMANLSGVTKASVWKHCRGVAEPDVESVARYMQRLGLTFSLIRPDLWPPSPPASPTMPSVARVE